MGDKEYLDYVYKLACRSSCVRRKYGAVIVKGDHIISEGCNKSPDGCTECSNVSGCLREQLNIPRGERYELCRSVHAEQNAIINANPIYLSGSTLYLVGLDSDFHFLSDTVPCELCKRFILASGIKKVVCSTGFNSYKVYEVRRWVY